MRGSGLCIPDIWVQDPAEQSPMERALAAKFKGGGSPFPPALASNVLAWWDAGAQKDVVYPLNQLVANGNFANGTTGWSANNSSNSIVDNQLTNTGDGSSVRASATVGFVSPGGIVGASCKAKVTSADCVAIELWELKDTGAEAEIIGTVNNPTQDVWYSLSGLKALSAGNSLLWVAHKYNDNATASGKAMLVEFALGTGLSIPLGPGNEPTATEFAAILAADGNQYWEGARNVICNPSGKYYAYDKSGNARHAKLYNMAYSAASGPQAGPPKHWKGDGVDDWMGRAEAGFIAQDADFSYVCCFSPSADNEATFLGYSHSSGFATGLVSRALYAGGDFYFIVVDRVSGSILPTITIATASNVFYIYAATYTQSDKKVRMYLNGTLRTTSLALDNGHVAINYIDAMKKEDSVQFTAQRQGISAWFNKSLTADEVKAIHNLNATRFGLTKV